MLLKQTHTGTMGVLWQIFVRGFLPPQRLATLRRRVGKYPLTKFATEPPLSLCVFALITQFSFRFDNPIGMEKYRKQAPDLNMHT